MSGALGRFRARHPEYRVIEWRGHDSDDVRLWLIKGDKTVEVRVNYDHLISGVGGFDHRLTLLLEGAHAEMCNKEMAPA